MKNESILRAMGELHDEMIEDADITKIRKTSNLKWAKTWRIAACLVFLIVTAALIAPLFGGEKNRDPLVITVYAYDEHGGTVSKELEVGERIKLYPKKSPHTANFDGFAFDLTLFGAKYVSPCAVDENWQAKRYTGGNYSNDDFHWALTEGDDIFVVWADIEGKVIQEDVLLGPRAYGSAIIWRPNEDKMSRNIIAVYGDDYELIARYYLEISEMNGDYYAEITKRE